MWSQARSGMEILALLALTILSPVVGYAIEKRLGYQFQAALWWYEHERGHRVIPKESLTPSGVWWQAGVGVARIAGAVFVGWAMLSVLRMRYGPLALGLTACVLLAWEWLRFATMRSSIRALPASRVRQPRGSLSPGTYVWLSAIARSLGMLFVLGSIVLFRLIRSS